VSQKQRIGLALLLLAAAVWMRGGGAIGRDISEDGLYVLVLEDGSRPEAITAEQGAVINSLRLLEAVRSKGGQYLKQDARDNFGGLGVWQQLRDKIPNPPGMAIAKGGSVRVEAIPSRIDDAVRMIER
jgi:hypothetical protein